MKPPACELINKYVCVYVCVCMSECVCVCVCVCVYVSVCLSVGVLQRETKRDRKWKITLREIEPQASLLFLHSLLERQKTCPHPDNKLTRSVIENQV